MIEKTLYGIWRNKKPNIEYVYAFWSDCFIINTKDKIRKFHSRVDQGTFIGYSKRSKSYRVYNLHTLIAEETIKVIFNILINL